jgi:hypothetical protein
VKAWQGDFQQIHRDMFPQNCVFLPNFFLHLKCVFANFLLISFIFNFKFMLCNCIIAIDLIFVDFRFYSFLLEICKIYMYINWHQNVPFPSPISIKSQPCLKCDKLIV